MLLQLILDLKSLTPLPNRLLQGNRCTFKYSWYSNRKNSIWCKAGKNPCSLCAKLRKGALNNAAKAIGYNKVAYAHHSDDVVETFLMSLFFEGRINTFSPVVHLDRKDIYIIRPFVYVEEIDIYGAVKRLNLPIVKNPCPANGNTNRQYFKDFIKNIRHDIPDIKENIMGAISNIDQVNIWDKEK